MRSTFVPAMLASGVVSFLCMAQDDQGPEENAVLTALEEAGVRLDRHVGLLSIPVSVGVREHLLEHALTGPAGESHEALFVTEVRPAMLNTGLILLGLEPGRDARWSGQDSPPREKEPSSGIRPVAVELPEGDGVYLYAAWRQRWKGNEEVDFYRVEDLVINRTTGHAMQRHPWVYIGSRMMWRDNLSKTNRRMESVFAADVLQDLINIPFFYEGNTLVTPALDDCTNQNTWIANSALLPESRTEITLILSRRPVDCVPEDLIGSLPYVDLGQRRNRTARHGLSPGRAK